MLSRSGCLNAEGFEEPQASYAEKGNKSLLTRADGEETVVGLRQLDDYFEYTGENPGPSVVEITSDTGRAFAERRRAEGVGNAVINRSLACLRRMLKIALEMENCQPSL